MAELKQCPFCGRIPKVEDCGTNRFFVKCECGIAQDKLYFQRCDAIRRWNTRKKYFMPSAQPEHFREVTKKVDTISRQAAIDVLETVGYDFSDSELSEIELEEVCETVGDVRQDMIRMIKQLPSAQPEIVRCKECKHYDGRPCGIVDWYNTADDFCSKAERREE